LSRIAFLFPGQGAQTVGMGRRLAESLPAARQLYDRAGEILGYDLAKLCFEGPAEELDSTVYSQPALFVTGLAALESLREESPDVVLSCEAAAGLSLGEYTALVFAGAMEFEDGLRLVQQRGAAMQEAADATPSGVGTIAACERAAEQAQSFGAMKAVPLAVAGAFHTQIMQPAYRRCAEAIGAVAMNRPKIPVVSNVDARPHDDPDDVRQLLIQQVVHPVRWEDSMRYLLDDGYDQFYEVGPGRVLRGLLRRVERKVSCQCVAT